MAIVQWHGSNFAATPIKQFDNGDWLMRADTHTARCSPGTEIRVALNEIIELGDLTLPPPAPPPGDRGAAALEAAMAAERETLPSVKELLAAARQKHG